MKVQYSIMYKLPGNFDLQFISLVTPVNNIHDFATLLHQQIRNGNIPVNANIVHVCVAEFIDE